MFNIPFGLRAKLVLLSGFLFAIPWLGYQYVWEMEKYLRQGQERTLIGTARALATALHERPNLFDEQASFLETVVKGRDLYAYPINQPIQLDGKLNDWSEYKQHTLHYADDHLIEGSLPYDSSSYQPDTLNFNHMVGKYDRFLYAFFEVFDDNVVYRAANSYRLKRNDHLKIALITPDGQFRHYIISNKESGWLDSYLLDENSDDPLKAKPETRIQGKWLQTKQGYNVEIRIPLSMLGTKIGFAITDVDDAMYRQQGVTIGTSDITDHTKLGTVLVPSPEIERIIKGMGHTSYRLWVVDQHQRVLAQTGDIRSSGSIWELAAEDRSQPANLWQQFEKMVLLPLYYTILTRPTENFLDELYDAGRLEGEQITSALTGKQKSQWRLTADKRAVILSAAYPIWIDNKVMGAVIAEETTNGIKSLRNKALEKLFNIILAVMTLGTTALFLFASRISSRIRKLRNETEQAIDEQGKIKNVIKGSKTRDEIGDLSRTFASIVGRLGQYNHYLENMSSRLSHELRTPVAVVRSSLENLAMQPLNDEAKVYMDRAQEGITRLNKIITNMSEATRLEQTLQSAEKEAFDLMEVLSGCVEGYKYAYPKIKFRLDLSTTPLNINGAPEYIAQLLDKLVNNAVEFSQDGQPVTITALQDKDSAIFSISNSGPALPEEMKDRIFDSMVSLRPPIQQKQPHLGIGLYIARLIAQFHQGKIAAENWADPSSRKSGVVVIVTLPLLGEL
ncbi:MAG: two-component system sensor histidine kinase ChvG [Alteromonadaceae bacterium]|jgi:two-component system sensor histidine kinase ChvG